MAAYQIEFYLNDEAETEVLLAFDYSRGYAGSAFEPPEPEEVEFTAVSQDGGKTWLDPHEVGPINWALAEEHAFQHVYDLREQAEIDRAESRVDADL